MTVTTGASVTGRFGGSVAIDCTVTGPEVNSIQWRKYINNIPLSITIDGVKFSGGSVSTTALSIYSLTNNDAFQYQCTASNPGGVYSSVKKAIITVECAYFYFDKSNIRIKYIFQRYRKLQKWSSTLALIINTHQSSCFAMVCY